MVKYKEKYVPFKTDQLRNLRVLVVDDNATSCRILKEMLINWRMKPTLADSGPFALALMQLAKDSGVMFDLFIIDTSRTDMDGFVLANQIRKHKENNQAPIIMLNSIGQRGDATRCREIGINAYLAKPVKQSHLLDAIMTTLGSPEPAEDYRAGLIASHSSQPKTTWSTLKEAKAFESINKIKRLAHSLKGAIGNFNSKDAY